eukprot:CAMPEP_0117671648 /NCGR_PEP_ID=MMETSP0804-20121206/13457_1 /TAXON_ID=1074897 /ORGANISM="Tetraselmis astigmatica, Strain CCMP880" /LENGTH=563 /DNA_ID=CAMNT_0005480145 /DNA_START=264 /DNA_END=1955 /DNA_ORIENTATION=+
MAELKKLVQNEFRASGLFLHPHALTSIVSFLESSGGDQAVIDSVLDAIEERRASMSSTTVSPDLLAEVLEQLAYVTEEAGLEPLQVISAFEVPRFLYNVHKKAFYQSAKEPRLHGDAADKMNVYIARMHLLQQRLRRNPLFSKPAFAGLVEGSKGADCELTDLKALQSVVGQPRFVMGCISQLEDGCYYLEDLSGALPVDLRDAVCTAGYFVENVIVVADGHLRPDGVFEVQALGMPPSEARQASVTAIQGVNMFGGNLLKGKDLEDALKAERDSDSRIVVLSDLWLDRDETLDKLEVVFSGYDGMEQPPGLFVLMGNFCSQASDTTDGTGTVPVRCTRQIKEGFTALGRLVTKFPRLQEQRWVIVPGPGDPAPGVMLPRPPLPSCVTAGFKEAVPTAKFTSNPCRIRWLTQEIVVFRFDIQQRMQRQCLLDPSGGVGGPDKQFEHLASTVLQQGHLCPLPLAQQPVYWQHDHAMHLFPLPHVLVLADGGGQSSISFHGCECVTPGSFCRDGHFASYCPGPMTLEMLALPEAMDEDGGGSGGGACEGEGDGDGNVPFDSDDDL